MTKRRRNVLLAIGAGALLWGGSEVIDRVRDARGYVVPAHGGRDTCRVWKSDTKEAVLARCGEPCGTGFVPKAGCPDELAKLQPGPIALFMGLRPLPEGLGLLLRPRDGRGADVRVHRAGNACSFWAAGRS